MKKEKTLKLNLSSVLAMITVLLTFFISAAIAKQMTSANAASDTDWNTTTTSWTQEHEYTTVPHSYTVPYSYTESDTSYTRWETETEHETATETSQTVPVMTPTEPDVETTNPYYTYEVYSGKVTITGANPAMGSSITIPPTLGGYPVTEIGDSRSQIAPTLQA